MNDAKTTLSQSQSYAEIGEFWDSHDLSEHWEQTRDAEFSLGDGVSAHYFSVGEELSQQLHALAKQRGVSAQSLLNLWLQERVLQETGPR